MSKLGQNFLQNESILKYEAQLVGLKDKKVLEIGAGEGRLTKHLLDHAPKKIIVVEKDPDLAQKIDLPVRVINKDFLDLDPFSIDVIVGNIPYYISSDILLKILEWDFDKAIFMVQEEFAQKLIASPGQDNYRRISVLAQLSFSIELDKKVSRTNFDPQPRVDSRIVILEKIRNLNGDQVQKITKLFNHKNKKVRNSIDYQGELEDKRVRNLTIEDCLKILNSIKN